MIRRPIDAPYFLPAWHAVYLRLKQRQSFPGLWASPWARQTWFAIHALNGPRLGHCLFRCIGRIVCIPRTIPEIWQMCLATMYARTRDMEDEKSTSTAEVAPSSSGAVSLATRTPRRIRVVQREQPAHPRILSKTRELFFSFRHMNLLHHPTKQQTQPRMLEAYLHCTRARLARLMGSSMLA